MATVLTRALPGVRVLTAASLAEARTVAARGKISLYILDEELPDGTGLDYWREIRAKQSRAKSILVSGSPVVLDEETNADEGGLDVLQKPFPLPELEKRVKALLGTGSGEELFEGTLKNLTITDVIQVKCTSAATTVLAFSTQKGESGRIYIRRGEIIHAEANGDSGVEAVNRIITWKRGSFDEFPLDDSTPHTIRQSWQNVILEAVRLSDEAATAE